MGASLQRSAEALARLFDASVVGCCLLLVGFQVHAGEASSLNIAVSDVFPATRPGLDFGDDPDAPLLAQASTESEIRQTWESALPPTDKFDWVQTTSGEWLKGELKVLYEQKLEFDSDEFGLQTLDLEDVAQLHGHGIERIRIETPEGSVTVVGRITVTKEKVIVDTDDGTQEFDRSQLIAIAPGAATEWDNWSMKISLGVNFSRGNTEETGFTAKANVERRTSKNRFAADYLGNFSRTGDIQTVNNHRLSAFFDVFATRQYFWRPIFFEYYRDPFQNVDSRATLGAGGGYHIIDTPKTSWDVAGGSAFRSTRFVSVQPGDSQKVTTPALVVGIGQTKGRIAVEPEYWVRDLGSVSGWRLGRV